MLDRVEHQTAAVRATFNSAAHDLRAPLHRIRVRLESAESRGDLGANGADVVADSVADLERVQRILATLLQIARADSAAAPGNDEPVDLTALAQELGDLYAPEALERGLTLYVHAYAPALVRGNRQLLAQLLANLLENAIKYVPSGGHVDVTVTTEDRKAQLTVRDDGPGIPEASRAQVLQPFHRLERDDLNSTGSGLGLSLVEAVVRLHHGQLSLSDNGPGLVVRCEFPLAPAVAEPPPAAPPAPAAPTAPAAPAQSAAPAAALPALPAAPTRSPVASWLGGVALLWTLLAGAPRSAAADMLRLVDDDQQPLQLSAPARRIVSLAPGSTAMLFAAGAGDRVVGTSAYSDEPAAAKLIERVGDSQSFDLERILRLRPDVVVVWSSGTPEAQIQRLQRVGLRVYRTRLAHLDDIPGSVLRLGRLTGTEAVARPAAQALGARLDQLRQRYAGATPQSVLIEIWDHPLYTVGGTELLSDVLAVCGFHNLFADLGGANPAVGVEAVLARNPDLILTLAPNRQAQQDWIEQWRAYPQLQAVRQGRVLGSVDQRLSRFGPGVIEATEQLCTLLRPGLDARMRGWRYCGNDVANQRADLYLVVASLHRSGRWRLLHALRNQV